MIDSNYLCYLLTKHKKYADKVEAYLVQVALGEKKCAASVYALTELYITLKRWFKWPEERAMWALDAILQNSNIDFLPLTEEIMRKVVDLRKKGYSYGDSIHLATLEANGLTSILSEDKDFDRYQGIERETL